MLFRTLQQNIQLRNVISDTLPFQLPVNLLTSSPSSVPRQTLQASVVHRSSIDSGQPDNNVNTPTVNNNLSRAAQARIPITTNITQSPRSPSSVDILEVMPLYPRPQNNSNHATNLYQMRGFKSREHNNNQAETSTDTRHLYSNDFNRDLALLRNTLRQEAVLNTIKDIEDETHFLQSRYMNENIPANVSITPLSPTLSNASEHYAQLSIEQQETARLYMNLVSNESNLRNASSCNDAIPTTPLTPKQVDYSNFNNSTKPDLNSYANLAIGDIAESINNVKQGLNFNFSTSEHTQKYSESDTYTSMSPVEELEVNYAVLDIDSNKETGRARELVSPENQSYASSKNESTTSQCSSQTRGRLVSQSSIEKVPTVGNSLLTALPTATIGYTTIDFDKTVALTSVASGTDDADSSRKTRHNSLNLTCSSPGSTDKSRGN